MSEFRVSRRTLGAAIATTTALTLAARSSVSAQSASRAADYQNGIQEDGSWRFRDDRGYDIHLPEPPTHIVSSIESGAALLDYGIEVLGVVGTFADATGWRDEGAGDLDENTVDYLGEWDNIDLEAILALEADLYVDVTYDATRIGSYSVSDSLADLMEQTVPTLAIAVGGGVKMPTPLERFEELAQALGVADLPQKMVDARTSFEGAEVAAREAFAEKSELTVALVAVGHTPGEMTFWDSTEFADTVYFHELGLNFLEIEPNQGYTLGISIEEAGNFDCDVMLNRIEPEDLFAEINEYPTLTLLPVIEAEQVYKWTTVYVPTYKGFLPVLEALTENMLVSEKVTG